MAVTREIEITIGTTVLGKGTSYFVDGKLQIETTYERASLEFDVVIFASSVSAFATAVNTLEEALSTPRQKVVVKFGTNTHQSWDPAVNTGFNMRGTMTKRGSPADTATSRRYRVRIDVELPADLSGQNGRQDSNVTIVTTESGRRRVFLSGKYTALGSNSAQQQYEASIGAYAAAVTGALGGTWEGPFDQQSTRDDTNKTLSFSECWEELIYNQSLGTLDNAALRRQTLKVSRLTEAPGDSPISGGDALRLETVEVTYEAAVLKSQTQDLKALYEGTVKPFLVDVARNATNATAVALVSHRPVFDYAQNTIAVAMTLQCVGNTTLIFCQARTDDAEDTGKDLIPVWDGDRLSKHEFQGPAFLTRTVTIVRRDVDGSAGGDVTSNRRRGGQAGRVGGAGSDQFGIFGINQPLAIEFVEAGGGGGGGAQVDPLNVVIGQPIGSGPGVPEPQTSPDGGQLVRVLRGQNSAVTPLILGRPGDPQIRVVDTTQVIRWEYIVRPKRRSTPVRTPTGGGGGNPHLGGGGAPNGGGQTVERTITGGGSAVSNVPGGGN